MNPRLLVLTFALGACSTAQTPAPAEAGAASSPAPIAPSPPTSESSSASPVSSAVAAPPASASVPAPSASAAPVASAAAGPVPDVKVVNIGMHIGGGPNDAPTKEPIKKSVEPHFDAFKRCFGLLEEKKGGDFGVDLRIGKDGGKAKVSHPRTALKGKEFERCVIDTFEAIDFLKPKTGETTVSYSLRFTP